MLSSKCWNLTTCQTYISNSADSESPAYNRLLFGFLHGQVVLPSLPPVLNFDMHYSVDPIRRTLTTELLSLFICEVNHNIYGDFGPRNWRYIWESYSRWPVTDWMICIGKTAYPTSRGECGLDVCNCSPSLHTLFLYLSPSSIMTALPTSAHLLFTFSDYSFLRRSTCSIGLIRAVLRQFLHWISSTLVFYS